MAEYTLNQVASKQMELLEKLKDLPATKEAEDMLDLLNIQVWMAHILADLINKKGFGSL